MLNPRLRIFFFAACLARLPGAPPGIPNNRIVTVNLVAVDNRGEIVDDLRRDDLRLFDAGKRRNIVFLRRIGSQPWNPPSRGPSEVSNRAGGFAPFATVVVVDMLNADYSDLANASTELAHALESIPDADSLFLYVLNVDGRLVPIHGIPFDSHFGFRTPTDSPPWTAHAVQRLKAELFNEAGPRRPTIPIWTHANLTFDALDSLATQLSRIPGRKNIVWINNGSPVVHAPGRPVLQTASHDPNEFPLLFARFSSIGVALYALHPFWSSRSFLNASSDATLDKLVAETGGRSDQGETIGDTIRGALRDARTSYQLGYEQPAPSGKAHRLRVETNRRGVRLRVSADYPGDGELAAMDFGRMIEDSAAPPFDTAQIGLRGILNRDPQDTNLAHMHILINPRDLALIHKFGAYTGSLRVAVAGYLPSGRVADSPIVPFELVFHHGEADHQRILDIGIQLTQDAKLGARITKVRFLVVDENSKEVGTLTFPLNADKR